MNHFKNHFEKLRALNLYAGIGGNRKLWENVDVTAVELDPEVAKVYQDYFPNDTVIVGDAHQYLLDHYREFDFIWSSPPCPSHSKLNTFLVPNGHRNVEYPDMNLYQEILLLRHWAKNQKWVVENVNPYYKPLIPGKTVDRHLFWSNFGIGKFSPDNTTAIKASDMSELSQLYGYDLSGYRMNNKRKAIRNCVHPETGRYILNCARNIITKSNTEQTGLFEEAK